MKWQLYVYLWWDRLFYRRRRIIRRRLRLLSRDCVQCLKILQDLHDKELNSADRSRLAREIVRLRVEKARITLAWCR